MSDDGSAAIRAFLDASLSAAERRVADRRGTTCRIGIADVEIRIQEDGRSVAPFLARHACPAPHRASARADLVFRSGPDALVGHPPARLFDALGRRALSEIAARSGLSVRLCHDPLVWEIWDPVRMLGTRLQRAPGPAFVWEETAPAANFLGWIAETRGAGMYHAATVGHGDRGILLVGDGGSGKSGATLGALRAGLSTCGDDYVLLSADAADGVSARPAYRSMKQDDAGLARCGIAPESLGVALNWKGKRVFRADQVAPGGLVDRLTIVGIGLPHVSGTSVTTIGPATPGAAFDAMMVSTFRQLETDRARAAARAAGIVRRLPAHRIAFGTDPEETSAALRDLLEAA